MFLSVDLNLSSDAMQIQIYRQGLGTTITARVPKMTTTIRISTSVNPVDRAVAIACRRSQPVMVLPAQWFVRQQNKVSARDTTSLAEKAADFPLSTLAEAHRQPRPKKLSPVYQAAWLMASPRRE